MPKRSRKRNSGVAHIVAAPAEPPPGKRWGLERWQALCSDPVGLRMLLLPLRAGYQLEAARVPVAVLGHVALLACYARNYEGVELVDDYDALLDRIDEGHLPEHVDRWLLSCLLILHRRNHFPLRDVFEDLGYDDVYTQLVTIEGE